MAEKTARGELAQAVDYTSAWATDKFNEWFPEWRWEARDVGAFKCIWASEHREGVLGGTERVARCRTWKAALVRAKVWAWKQRKLAALKGGGE